MELSALILNCTLKQSPEASNTQGLIDLVTDHFGDLGVKHETLPPVDYEIPFGVVSDLAGGDQWTQILQKMLAADILIMGMSIWFGVRSSVCQMVIERLDGAYNTTNDVGQYPLYNTVGGVAVTGNEDGAHACAETTLFNLTHLGCAIPPNADTYWVGDAWPGPSFIEAGGKDHPFTQKTASWMAHNVFHLARILKEHPIPPEGNTVPGGQPEDCAGHHDRMPGGHVG